MIEKVGNGALLLAIALAPVIGGYPAGGAYGADIALNALRALVLVAALCSLVTEPKGERQPAPKTWATWALWAAFALSLVSLLAHSRFLTSPVLLFAELPATINWLCYTLIFVLCAGLAHRNRHGILWIAGAVGVGVAWAALSGVHDYGQSAQAGNRSERISGPFFDPNFLAGFLALGLPIVIAACLAARERLQSLGSGVIAALTVGALTATGSRAGLGVALVGIVITVVLAKLTVRGSLSIGRMLALAVACVALVVVFRGPITARAGASQSHSNEFRAWTWKGTSGMIAANPLLGTGPGTFPYRYPPYALVEKSGLAHESYLELAAEQGVPVLLAVLCGIIGALFTGMTELWKLRGTQPGADDAIPRLLMCGFIGALIAGCARSGADSEWAILGNAMPFWSVAGVVAAGISDFAAKKAAGKSRATLPMKLLAGAGLCGALGMTFALLHSAQVHDAAQASLKTHANISDDGVWPPDPDLLYWTGHADTAAIVEPSGRSFYRLARMHERDGDEAGAIAPLQSAVKADPNNLQSWRALAEAQEKSGDSVGALASWAELVRRAEGPSGQIRAIPELPETHPAFAYAALADAALKAGKTDDARSDYEKSAQVIESYSQTPPLYQQTELITALSSGVDLAAKHQEIEALYQRVINALITLRGASSAASADLKQKEQDTLSRLGKFPDSLDEPGSKDAGVTPGAAK